VFYKGISVQSRISFSSVFHHDSISEILPLRNIFIIGYFSRCLTQTIGGNIVE